MVAQEVLEQLVTAIDGLNVEIAADALASRLVQHLVGTLFAHRRSSASHHFPVNPRLTIRLWWRARPFGEDWVSGSNVRVSADVVSPVTLGSTIKRMILTTSTTES
jgi:hypothetical protein